MNQYSAYSLVSMLNGNNNSTNDTSQSGYPYSNHQPPGFNTPDFHRGSSQKSYNNYGNQNRPYNGWGEKTDPELNVDEIVADHSFTVLDHYNCDLNLLIDLDGYGAYPLTEPEGFCFCWAGARATYGVTRGKVFFEVHVTENLPVSYGDNHQEVDPHVVRLGWSVDSCCFQLGESENSFGYGGTGKFSVNLKFSDYGERFGVGDVIGSLLDLQSHPPTISFTKNGHWFGTAYTLHNYPVGVKSKALFPHIITKNCRFKVNFGQTDTWFAPPPGFVYIDHVPLDDRVRGLTGPSKKAECEMNMIVGLPGVGKTTFGLKKQKDNPEKRYNIIGTDTLIDKMRVMGLPRKRNYHGRWEVLMTKSSKCLNKLFQVGSRRKRNYILDQTNVYASARRNKMKHFQGFQRNAWVLVPEHDEFERRSIKRTVEDGKIVPVEAVLEMKANFKLPVEGIDPFDKIEFVELKRKDAAVLVDNYVKEGIEKRPPRELVFRFDNKPHPIPSPVRNPQPAQNKVSDPLAAAVAAVRAAINYPVVNVEPGTVKIEPGTVKIEPGSLATPVATALKPNQYTTHVATTAVKTEPVSDTITAECRKTPSNQKEEKETDKGNINMADKSSSSTTAADRKTCYREESRRGEHRRRSSSRSRSHKSRSRSRSRSRSSSRYSDKNRYGYRRHSERDRRDRHHSDRYRERERDRYRHRSHHRSDSHGRRRGSEGRHRDHRDDKDSSYHSDSSSRHSDHKYSESQLQNSKKSTPNSKPSSPTNHQLPQKPAESGSLESKWPQSSSSVSDSTEQQCLSGGSDYQNPNVQWRQMSSPFDAVGKDKTDFKELFGNCDVDYRVPSHTSDYSKQASRSQPGSYTSWQSQSQSTLNSYGQSQQPVSQQLPISRSVLPPPPPPPPPPQPQISLPVSTYPQPPQSGYYEEKKPNNFGHLNYQNYSASYTERSDSFSSINSSMPFSECQTSASDNNRNYPPGEDTKNFNQNYPGVMNQPQNSENQPSYSSSDEMRKQNLDNWTSYTPLKSSAGVASHLANTQLTSSLYPPYTLEKATNPSSEAISANFPSSKDSDLRFAMSTRNENEIRVPAKDNSNALASAMKSFSSVPRAVLASSPNNYSSEGPPPTEPFNQSTNIQLPPDNPKTQDSYSFGNQSMPVHDHSQRWGDKGHGGESSSAADIPTMMQNIPLQSPSQQIEWPEGNLNPTMPPPLLNSLPSNFMRFPPNYPSYSGYSNMPPNMGRRYPF